LGDGSRELGSLVVVQTGAHPVIPADLAPLGAVQGPRDIHPRAGLVVHSLGLPQSFGRIVLCWRCSLHEVDVVEADACGMQKLVSDEADVPRALDMTGLGPRHLSHVPPGRFHDVEHGSVEDLSGEPVLAGQDDPAGRVSRDELGLAGRVCRAQAAVQCRRRGDPIESTLMGPADRGLDRQLHHFADADPLLVAARKPVPGLEISLHQSVARIAGRSRRCPLL
jgi:hypothetical protein